MQISKSRILRWALQSARVTRCLYQDLKVSRHQGVRNPYPMRVLVATVLPKSYGDKGLTVDEVVHKLQDAGFIANRMGVIQGLHIARTSGAIQSFRSTRVLVPGIHPTCRRKSTSIARYFIPRY